MSGGRSGGRARRVVLVVVAVVLLAVALVAVNAYVRARAEVQRMDAVVDALQPPAGWELTGEDRTTPPLGLCVYSVQACPSTQLTYSAANPAEDGVDLEALLPDADWVVEKPDCSAPADANGNWSSCAASADVDGFTVHAGVHGATFDDVAHLAVEITPNRS
ncbi:hypothetical protein [Cellulomonas sp. URHB0016]